MKKEIFLKKEKKKLNIIFENKNFILINKMEKTLTYDTKNTKKNILSMYYAYKGRKVFDNVRCGVVHRLDYNTTGIIIITKNNETYLKIKKKFIKRKIKKYYLIIIDKKIKKKNFFIKGYLKNKFSVSYYKKILSYKIKNKIKTLLICKILTGRKNQIKKQINNFFNTNKICLHSWKISFSLNKSNIKQYSNINKKIIKTIINSNIKFLI